MSQGKVKSLAMLFNSYPGLTWSVEATRAKVEAFLLVLEDFSDEQVAQACKVVMRRDSPFPPSAGELAAECKQAVVYTPDPDKLARLRLEGPPPDQRTAEEKAASRARVAKMMEEYRAGLPKPEEEKSGVGSAWKPLPLGALLGGVFAELEAEAAQKAKAGSESPAR